MYEYRLQLHYNNILIIDYSIYKIFNRELILQACIIDVCWLTLLQKVIHLMALFCQKKHFFCLTFICQLTGQHALTVLYIV